ncbi:MAG: hypothetical protein VB858_09440 [Planctomycetaceae bacterium]
METFIEGCLSWPTYPATLLLLLICSYWILVVVGAVGLDSLDIDINMDVDFDVDASILQFGFLPIKWLNLGSVPTMLWASVFSLSAWLTSRLINSPAPHDTFIFLTDGQAILRDIGIAVLCTKCITQPLVGRFDPVEPNRAVDLIGALCTVTTTEVTETFGEAQYSTDGAPLKLTVRTESGVLSKGDTARIINFDAEQNSYTVILDSGGA